MDIVDDVIRHLGLRSRIAYRLERIGSWDGATRDSGLMQLHCVLDGTCRFSVDAQSLDRCARHGEVLLLPRGGCVDVRETPIGATRIGEPTDRPDTPKEARILILGVDVELAGQHQHPLFSGLPAVMLIDRASFVASGTREHAGYLIEQTGTRESGGESAIVDRLVEILLIQAIKAHFTGQRADSAFMQALQDPAISRAIAAVHGEPGHNWNLQRLAATSGLSRSAFSRRFTELTGVPAMHYLTVWRMQIALQTLKVGFADLQTIARSVGYLSPSAFQKAFKRIHGITPAQAAAAGSRRSVA